MSRPLGLVAGAALALVLAGCVNDEAGLGIPTENLVQPPSAASEPIEGELHVSGNGCFHVVVDGVQHVVVWPEGFRQDSAVVIGADGSRFSGGDALSGEGWVRPADDVIDAADGPDGYMGAIIGYCAEEDEQVVVFESLESGQD